MVGMFNSEYCPFWTGQTRWFLAVYCIMTVKYINICNTQRRASRTPCSTAVSLGYSSIYLSLFYCSIRNPLPTPTPSLPAWTLSVIEGWPRGPARLLVCLLQTSKSSSKALPPAAAYFRLGLLLDEWVWLPYLARLNILPHIQWQLKKKSEVIIRACSSCSCHINLTSKCVPGLQQGGIPRIAFQVCHIPFSI